MASYFGIDVAKVTHLVTTGDRFDTQVGPSTHEGMVRARWGHELDMRITRGDSLPRDLRDREAIKKAEKADALQRRREIERLRVRFPHAF